MFQRNLFVKVALLCFVKPKMKDLDRSISLKHNINELNVWSWAWKPPGSNISITWETISKKHWLSIHWSQSTQIRIPSCVYSFNKIPSILKFSPESAIHGCFTILCHFTFTSIFNSSTTINHDHHDHRVDLSSTPVFGLLVFRLTPSHQNRSQQSSPHKGFSKDKEMKRRRKTNKNSRKLMIP